MAKLIIDENGGLRTETDLATGEIRRLDIPVAPSPAWRVRHLVRKVGFGRFNRMTGSLEEQAKRALASGNGLTFKNGKPRYFVADYDHGTARLRMGGVRFLAIEP